MATLAQAITRGNFADRPATGAGKGGQTYYATDTHEVYHDDGTGWALVATNVTEIDEVPGLTAALAAKAADSDLTAHISDATAAHAASAVAFTPAGTIAATDVQAAIAEVASEAASDLSTHIADATAAHAASAIAFTPAGTIAATDAQAAIAEVASEAATALSDHISDATAAHAASAIAFTPDGSIAATTVQAAIQEVRDEAAAGIAATAYADLTDVDTTGLGAGDLAYFNGTDWVIIDATGNNGNILRMTAGTPGWGAENTGAVSYDELIDVDVAGLANLQVMQWIAASNEWQPYTLPTALPPNGAAGGVLAGTYPNPSFAADMATQAELDAAKGLPLGLTGAVAATRFVGGTASVAPTTGTFAVGDFVITQAGSIYICTVAGTPGTWVAVSGGGGTYTEGAGIDITSLVVSVDIPSLTADASPDSAADYVMSYDASASAHKKVLMSNLPGGSVGNNAASKLFLAANYI